MATLDRVPNQTFALGDAAQAVEAAFEDWRANQKIKRLWARDKGLWSGADEDRWLGWLNEVDSQLSRVDRLQLLAADVHNAGFAHALLLGMGGSSLCADVLKHTFGAIEGFPELHVLDSTVPAQIEEFETRIDIKKTLFIVSSKSGGTAEPNALQRYFFGRVRRSAGSAEAGSRFIAITDPGTSLERLARKEQFRHVVHGQPDIGGRYSALSNFGTVPAAIMGLDMPPYLQHAQRMARACGPASSVQNNPGLMLGLIMGSLAGQGRDKLTLITTPGIAALGGWLEQLIAESTGKHGKGIVPIDGETLGTPELYGDDRLFVYLRLAIEPSPALDAAVDRLEQAGQPVVRITLNDRIELGREFFRWEVATAVAGAVMSINPFDQPDVEASKTATRELSARYESRGELAPESPLLSEGGLQLFADPMNADSLGTDPASSTLKDCLRAHLNRLSAKDYFAINAYVAMNEENRRQLQTMRHRVRDAKRVATTLGVGPRFLHSTGQLHKGGPNNGVFVQITSDDARDLAIPDQKNTFGILKRFQAQGDFEVLAERKRRVVRVHLGSDVGAGLTRLNELIDSALANR